jgi:hypothetical protein
MLFLGVYYDFLFANVWEKIYKTIYKYNNIPYFNNN